MAISSEDLYFRVSPRVIAPLGIEQLQDPALAVLELIKNAWDADASQVKIRIEGGKRIVVEDDGGGMSERDFKDRWLMIGSSYKRDEKKSNKNRPFIGEKGLGRLATFALGSSVRIETADSKNSKSKSFAVTIDWAKLFEAKSLDAYKIKIQETNWSRGTRVEIKNLTGDWTNSQTDYLVAHAEFLTSMPGSRFEIQITVDDEHIEIDDPFKSLERAVEASIEIEVLDGGIPKINSCKVKKHEFGNKIIYRPMLEKDLDPRLVGTKVNLKFFRRDELEKNLTKPLEKNLIKEMMERYQGVRIFKNQINVPPYGISGDDWARLEKQRTSTGGPTLTPGNSQIYGEVHLRSGKNDHMIVTAGRSGFADQDAVAQLSEYVRWAVRALATARRADIKGIKVGVVPSRTDAESNSKKPQSPSSYLKGEVSTLLKDKDLKKSSRLTKKISEVAQQVSATLEQNDYTLRLYAQLASTGIAATSFAHELRTEFDVISEAVDHLKKKSGKADKEIIGLLSDSWVRVRSFANLFQVVPIKLRRRPKTLQPDEVERVARAILGLATPQKIRVKVIPPKLSIKMVPAELDSILVNLVSNSIKAISASKNRETGEIEVVFSNVGLDLHFCVQDNGTGISESTKEIMFEPLEGAFAEGTGMGLPIVKFLAEKYDGSAIVSEKPAKGFVTSIEIELRNVGVESR